MPDKTAAFFAQLEGKRHNKFLEGTSGIVLLQVRGGEEAMSWYVVIKRGDVTVSREGEAADCVITTDRATLEAIIGGELNPMPAILRGLLEVDGDVRLLIALQSLFRPSAGAADQSTAGYAGRPS